MCSLSTKYENVIWALGTKTVHVLKNFNQISKFLSVLHIRLSGKVRPMHWSNLEKNQIPVIKVTRSE